MVQGEHKNVDTFYGYLTDYENSPRYFARIFNAEKDSESIEDEIWFKLLNKLFQFFNKL